jgi:hypothetical protein
MMQKQLVEIEEDPPTALPLSIQTTLNISISYARANAAIVAGIPALG